jgi:hypothetical protein
LGVVGGGHARVTGGAELEPAKYEPIAAKEMAANRLQAVRSSRERSQDSASKRPFAEIDDNLDILEAEERTSEGELTLVEGFLRAEVDDRVLALSSPHREREPLVRSAYGLDEGGIEVTILLYVEADAPDKR